MSDFTLPPDWQITRAHAPLSETIDWAHRFLGTDKPAWYEVDCSAIKVGVLDTGCPKTHPDLDGAIVDCFDFTNSSIGPYDLHGHGTWCLGYIGAIANTVGIRGIAAGCKLYSLKCLGDSGGGTDATCIAAVKKAIDLDLDVISLSWGGPVMSAELRQLLASFRGVVFAAAGNDGRGTPVNYPAKWPEVGAIAALDKNGELTTFSSYEPGVVLCCVPGQDMMSTIPGGYGLMSGTSMACPAAAGIAAKIIAKHRLRGGATPLNTRLQLFSHIRDFSTVRNGLRIIDPPGLLKAVEADAPAEVVKQEIWRPMNRGWRSAFDTADIKACERVVA